MVCAFEINQSKRHGALSLSLDFYSGKMVDFRAENTLRETTSVIKIVTDNGRVHYGIVDKFVLIK